MEDRRVSSIARNMGYDPRSKPLGYPRKEGPPAGSYHFDLIEQFLSRLTIRICVLSASP